MISTVQLNPRLTRLIQIYRWVMPITLSALGLAYVSWENLVQDRHLPLSVEMLTGFALLGVFGPLLVFITLTWAARASAAWERAEQARERQLGQLVALQDISRAVNESLELETVLNRSLEQVLNVLHLESGGIRLIEQARLVLLVSRALSPTFVAADRIVPLGTCICGSSAQRGELMAVESLKASGMAASRCACEKFQSVLTVPVRTAERVVGVIHVASKEPRTFDPAERALLTAIGYQIGVALEKAQLHSQVQTLNKQLEQRVANRTEELLAAKEELTQKAAALQHVLAQERRIEEKTRAQIAHDLHDGVQQVIVGTLFETQAASDALALHPETAATRLAAAQALLHRIQVEMRSAIYSLRPMALDLEGLVPALDECAADFERMAQIPCRLQVKGTPRRLNADVEMAAFRVVQEALNNIQAHAHASQARIILAYSEQEIRIQVSDSGVGFDLGALSNQPNGHFGLVGMRERAESVGGRLEIQSRPGEGSSVTFRVPLTR